MEEGVNKHLHEVPLSESLAQATNSTPFHALISKLLDSLHKCLLEVDYTKLCPATRRNPLPLWPTVTSDLLPFEGEVAVNSFLQWAEIFNLPVAHAALFRVLMCTRSLVRPYLLEEEALRLSLLKHFTPINQPTSGSLALEQKKALADLFDDILECFMTAVDIDGDDGVVEWIGEDADEFMTLCNNALGVTFPKSEFARSNFEEGPASALATLVLQLRHSPYAMLDMTSPTHVEIQKLTIRSFPGGAPEMHYFQALCKIHAYRVGRQECAALDCDVKAEQMTDSAMKLCSGCRCMAYCSEECQIAEWTSAVVPHKKACKTFRVFTPYLDELKEGAIRKTAKKCLQEGVPKIEAMNADYFLGVMERHRVQW